VTFPNGFKPLHLQTYLDLEHNSFVGKIPACIGNLIKLLHLNLSDNYELAGELPIGICDLVNLDELEIEDTSVEGINITHLMLRHDTRMHRCTYFPIFPLSI
jgi:hypothetical protein